MSEAEQSAKSKRRAQVRKAQIQHRARKADYTKQLEADIAAIREQIEDVEQNRRILRTENQRICAQLFGVRQQAAGDYGQPSLDSAGLYMTPSFCPSDTTTSYGFDINSASLDYCNVDDVSLNDMLVASGEYYDHTLPASAGSSRESSSGRVGSPQYMGNESSTPYPLFSEMSSHSQSSQAMNYVSSFL